MKSIPEVWVGVKEGREALRDRQARAEAQRWEERSDRFEGTSECCRSVARCTPMFTAAGLTAIKIGSKPTVHQRAVGQ